MKEELEL